MTTEPVECVTVEARYRPLGDVLVIDVPLLDDTIGARVDHLDADVDRRLLDTGTISLLIGARVVHARSRWLADRTSVPLADLLALGDVFERAARHDGDSLAARARTMIRSSAAVPLRALAVDGAVMHDGAVTSASPRLTAPHDLVRGLLLVAEAVDQAALFSVGHDPLRTSALVIAVRELADVLRRRGDRPAPGATIAVLRRLSGPVPLGAGERVTLRSLVDQCLEVRTWPVAAEGLTALASVIAPWSTVVRPGV